MDKKIFDFIYGISQKNKRLGNICNLAAKASSVVFFAIYIFVFLVLLVEGSEKKFLYITVPLIVLSLNITLRKLVKRPRPLDASKFDSFPSNHSASASIIALACFYVNSTLGTVVLLLALMTGLLRLFTGKHYLTDVLAGFFISAVVSLLFSIR